MHEALREPLRDALPIDERYDESFDIFEAIYSLNTWWVGRYGWARKWDRAQFLDAVQARSAELVEIGLVASDEELAEALKQL
ncbi:hypothetical protein RCL06_24015, partial [Salmonella enterica subsp. enterica serovar Typhimurium]